MHKHVVSLTATLATLGALVACTGSVRATDYPEREPNTNLPSTFLPGSPVLRNGDRLTGNIGFSDYDNHLLTLDGSGPAGLYRYTLTTSGGDPVLTVYDTSVLADGFGHLLGANDDFPDLGTSSRIIFDQFTSGTDNPVFDVSIRGFETFNTFSYALSIARTATPVTDLGVLGDGTGSVSNANAPGAGFWYRFTLNAASEVAFDTLGSAIEDTELALFDQAGNTLVGNDNGLEARASARLARGTYYVAVGSYNFNEDIEEEEGSFYNWDELFNTSAGWDRNGFGSSVVGGVHQLNYTVTTIGRPVRPRFGIPPAGTE